VTREPAHLKARRHLHDAVAVAVNRKNQNNVDGTSKTDAAVIAGVDVLF